ncbi:MAG: cysteine-rich KTR domain-containing protein [Thomasclavelia ramosa]|uniref:cysteine-rich KTR domain-containing protein n=1 Tax=Thomasclavelia ramosa TaxID=1547 RepID=UPI0022E7B89A|nr:cysteine-rich KTR domain-containing protein [Thomasclavelia ramosa]MDU4735936.1 cysteine-rich KTR domain-containing protein [Thomasclavelia ramosa]
MVYCPLCGNKTRVQIREDTELKNFPLYCPKCKKETLIDVKSFIVTIGKDNELF